MLIKTKIALSLAMVLGLASVATAAPKHPVHRHQTAVERQVPAAALQSFGSAAVHPVQTMRSDTSGMQLGQEPDYMYIQDKDSRHSD